MVKKGIVGVVLMIGIAIASGCAIIDDLVNNRSSDLIVQGVTAYCKESITDRPTVFKVANTRLAYEGYAVKLSCSPIGN